MVERLQWDDWQEGQCLQQPTSQKNQQAAKSCQDMDTAMVDVQVCLVEILLLEGGQKDLISCSCQKFVFKRERGKSPQHQKYLGPFLGLVCIIKFSQYCKHLNY